MKPEGFRLQRILVTFLLNDKWVPLIHQGQIDTFILYYKNETTPLPDNGCPSQTVYKNESKMSFSFKYNIRLRLISIPNILYSMNWFGIIIKGGTFGVTAYWVFKLQRIDGRTGRRADRRTDQTHNQTDTEMQTDGRTDGRTDRQSQP